MYTCIPSLGDLPPHSHSTPLGHHKAQSWVPSSMLFSSFPLAISFTHGSVYMLDIPVVKNLPANGGDTRDAGSIPDSGRSPGGGLSCPKVCGILPDQELNLCLPHWQADSLSLSHQGNATQKFFMPGCRIARCHFLHILLLEVETDLYLWLAGVVCMYQKVMLFAAMFDFFVIWTQVDQMVKNLPAMPETRVWSLDRDDPLEKGMATYSSILAQENPMDRGVWWATVHEVAKGQTQLRDFHFLRRLATTIHLVAIIYSPPIWKYTVSSPKISKYLITSSTSLKFRIRVDQVTIKSTVASLVAVGKESACNAGDLGSIPGSEDPMEKEMATHSCILAWGIP